MSFFSKILENLAQAINKELDKHALKNTSQNLNKETTKEASQNASKEATQNASKNTIKGENFTTTQSTPSKSDYNIKMELSPHNRLDASLIVKRLENQKIGKMVVKKDSVQDLPATKVKEKDLDRLQRVDKKHSGDKSLALSKTSSSKAAEQEALNLDSQHNSTKNQPQKQDSTLESNILIKQNLPPMERE